jgi:hypothetical protein
MGTSTVDLYPLLCFPELKGWYHIEDEENKPVGEILVSVVPSKTLTNLNKSLKLEDKGVTENGQKSLTSDPFFTFLQTSYVGEETRSQTTSKQDDTEYQKEMKTLKKLRQDLEQLNKQMKKG